MCHAYLNMFQKLYEITRWIKAEWLKTNLGTAKQPLRHKSKEVHCISCNEVNVYSKFDYYVQMFNKNFLVGRMKKYCDVFPDRWCSHTAQML